MNEGLVVFVRGLIAFFTLLIFARLLGKQQVSELTLFEYILGITIGSTASTLTSDLSSAAWPHWVGVGIWTGLVLLVQWITLKSKKLFKYINGEPVIIILNGKIMDDSMRKMRYTLYDLLEQLRNMGIFDIGEVEFAILETNGKLSVLKKSQYQPLTPNDMNVPTDYKGISTELIFNGIIIDNHLKNLNLDRQWLFGELNKKGIQDASEVFFATLDTSGNLYVDTYKDKIDFNPNMNR